MRSCLSFVFITALASLTLMAGQAPEATPPEGSYDLSQQEVHTLTPMPTRAQPHVLEGSLTMGSPTLVPRTNKRNYLAYRLTVPPGARLKAQLQHSPQAFRVVFLSGTKGRNPDPGLNANRINFRTDRAFYENKTKAEKTIYCIVEGMEPMEHKHFAVVFTDF